MNDNNRRKAAIALISDLLTFIDDAASSRDIDLRVRARVLVARVDLEVKAMEKRKAMSNQELAAELGVQHGD